MKQIEYHIEQFLKLGNQNENKVLYQILLDLTQGKMDFLKLIQDPNYGFNDGLSPRMRSWYDEKGLLISDRNPEKQGKRKLSFINKVWFELVVYCKDKKIKFDTIKSFKDILMQPIPKYDFTLLELYTLTALCNLNLEDYFMKLDLWGFPLISANISPDIPERRSYVNLSRLLRESLFHSDDINDVYEDRYMKYYLINEYNPAQDKNFTTNLVRFIDIVRKKLSLPTLADNESYQDYKALYIALSYKPLSKLRKRWDFIIEDGKDNLFGVDIKFVGKSKFINSLDQKAVISSDEEVIKAIKDEMNGYLKFVLNRLI